MQCEKLTGDPFYSRSPIAEYFRSRLLNMAHRTVLPEDEAKALLRDIGLRVPAGVYIPRGNDLPESAQLNYPLAAKVTSEKIKSKTDIGGIYLDIKDKDELSNALRQLAKIEIAEGILIEEMAPEGIEVIVGGIQDLQFGPVVMFGLGGVSVELFNDVTFALAPLDKEGAMKVVKQVRSYRLLEGFRGRKPVKLEPLLEVIVAVSELTATGLIREIDLNPVVLYPDSAVVLDAKIYLNRTS